MEIQQENKKLLPHYYSENDRQIDRYMMMMIYNEKW